MSKNLKKEYIKNTDNEYISPITSASTVFLAKGDTVEEYIHARSDPLDYVEDVLYLGHNGVGLGDVNTYITAPYPPIGYSRGLSTLVGPNALSLGEPFRLKGQGYNDTRLDWEASNNIVIGNNTKALVTPIKRTMWIWDEENQESVEVERLVGWTNGQIIIGHDSQVSGTRSIAIGFHSYSQALNTIVIGTNNMAYGNHAISIGDSIQSNFQAISIGSGLYTTGLINIGHSNMNYANQSTIVIGHGINTNTNHDTLIGSGIKDSNDLGLYDFGKLPYDPRGRKTVLGSGCFCVAYGTAVGASASVYSYDFKTSSASEYAYQERYNGGVALGNSAAVYYNSIGIGAGVVTQRNGQIKLRAGIPNEEGTQEIELRRGVLINNITIDANTPYKIIDIFKGFGYIDSDDDKYSQHTGLFRLFSSDTLFILLVSNIEYENIKYIDLLVTDFNSSYGVHLNAYNDENVCVIHEVQPFSRIIDLAWFSLVIPYTQTIEAITNVLS